MKINFDVELDTTDEPEVITVELEGYPEVTDNAYDDEFGTVRQVEQVTMEDSWIKWNHKEFTPEQNGKIWNWAEENAKKIEEKFCNQFLKDKNDSL